MKTTVIHHSADYDGIFCREIARKFLPDAELIGWDFGQMPVKIPEGGPIYVMDLPLDCINASDIQGTFWNRIVWIDHHKSAIEKFRPPSYPLVAGYRIDGVAACRLAWFYFTARERYAAQTITADFTWFQGHYPWATKQEFVDRKVSEPLAVRLAGEYDVWDHRGDGDLEFQFGLDCQTNLDWEASLGLHVCSDNYTNHIVLEGRAAMACYKKRDADIMRERSFLVEFEGLKFLALNTARCNSNTFAARDVPETGHDALMGFYFNGRVWTHSLYHANHRKDIDLSLIAVKFGGGGHRGACGFATSKPPFLP